MEWNDSILTETYKESVKKESMDVPMDSTQAQLLQSKYTRDYVNKSGVPNRRFYIWKVGMPCRALYHEDGLEYEATIKAVTKHGYIVEYVGYGNEEEVPNNELKITAGKEARDKQLMESQQEEGHQQEEEYDDEEEEEEEGEEDFTSRGVYVKQQNTYHPKNPSTQPHERRPTSHNPRDQGQSTSRHMPPPPRRGMSNRYYSAPSNERAFNSDPNTRYFEMPRFPNHLPTMPLPMPLPMPSSHGDLEKVESSMLMNWYMCGYYTGLHQAMKSSNK